MCWAQSFMWVGQETSYVAWAGLVMWHGWGQLCMCLGQGQICGMEGPAVSLQQSRFWDEIQKKALRVLLLSIHSHLYSFTKRFLFLQTHTTSYSVYSIS